MKELFTRGVVDFIPPINKPVLNVKAGFDPTSPHLHLGHCVLLKKLRDFQLEGHNVIIIIGDFTATIGDPTGKSNTRVQLREHTVKENAEKFLSQIFRILDKDKTIVKFNSDWWSKMTAADMIKLSSSITVSRMLDRDDFKKRFESHVSISMHEFLYPLLQGHDSVIVNSDIEIGGTDQLFNLHMGRNRQSQEGMEPQGIMTLPILLGTDGVNKMSKSLNNTINIDDNAFTIRQKILNMPDSNIPSFMWLLTGESLEEGFDILETKKLLCTRIIELLKSSDDGILTLEVKEDSLPIPAIINRLKIAKNSAAARDVVSKGSVLVDGIVVNVDTRINNNTSFELKVGKKEAIQVKLIGVLK